MLSDDDKLEIETISSSCIVPEFGSGHLLDVELFISNLYAIGYEIVKKELTNAKD